MQPNCADSINTVDVNLTGHWSGLKYHEFTKKKDFMYLLCVHACTHSYFKKAFYWSNSVTLSQK